MEVIAKDTLLVEPQEWIYVINPVPSYEQSYADLDTSVYSGTENNPNTGMTKEITQIKELTDKYHGQLLMDAFNDLSSLRSKKYYWDNEMTLRFTQRQDLEHFIQALSSFKDLKGEVVDCFVADLQQSYALLDIRLIEQAKQKAARLAELSGKKLGNIILLSEETATDNAFREFLAAITKIEKSTASQRVHMLKEHSDMVKLEKSLKVRFAWK